MDARATRLKERLLTNVDDPKADRPLPTQNRSLAGDRKSTKATNAVTSRLPPERAPSHPSGTVAIEQRQSISRVAAGDSEVVVRGVERQEHGGSTIDLSGERVSYEGATRLALGLQREMQPEWKASLAAILGD